MFVCTSNNPQFDLSLKYYFVCAVRAFGYLANYLYRIFGMISRLNVKFTI